MAKAILSLELQAAELGETDEALSMCDTAMSLRNWYHAYLAGKEVIQKGERIRKRRC